MTQEFEIVVKGHVDREWDDLFEGFSFEHLPDGTTLLRGEVADQPALQGILAQISMLGWRLLRAEEVGNIEGTDDVANQAEDDA